MKSFLKTYAIVLGVILGILTFIGLLFWGLSKIFGENAPIIAFFLVLALLLSFAITSAIENG